MSRAVLLSVRPRWCGDILTGKKTIEVRRTKPKILPPFKTYIYCTGGETLYRSSNDGEYRRTNLSADSQALSHHTILNGMVIAEFVCDWCDPFPPGRASFAELALGSIVPPRDLYKYAAGETLYGWHISEPKAYADPLPLSAFRRWEEFGEDIRPCQNGKNCEHLIYDYGEDCQACAIDFDGTDCPFLKVTRPPQSWMYVEELP